MQWIPKQIVAIGEDFHSQVGEGKVRTTLYKVRWEGYDKKDDTWEPITHLQGYATMVKAFKESHAKDVEKLAADRVREAEKKNRFPICLMTNSVRKASFSIGLGVCQGTLMSTRRTLTSLGCGDSSMVALHLEAG